MTRKRARPDQFSMSFLDCMCCGFGAVILLFMIINSQIKEQIELDKIKCNQVTLSETGIQNS